MIVRNYEYGDNWKWRNKKNDQAAEKLCPKCNRPFGVMGQKRHMQAHKKYEEGQNSMSEYFG